MKKFYKVIAKCGHVGKGKYYEGTFYIVAQDGKQAALITRKMPRVKHDYKDAILSVEVINKAEYITGLKESKKNPYFKCHCIQDQNVIIEFIQDNLKEENHRKKQIYNKEARKSKADYKRNKLKISLISHSTYFYEDQFCRI